MSPISRRQFFANTAAAATGLAISFYLPESVFASPDSADFSPNAYLHIAPDGKITVVVARSEMGQGVRTALPMILAEELEADWKQIGIEQAGASTLFGDQTTGGSASVRTTWDPMRQAGAAAREMLIAAAASVWNVKSSECHAESSFVVHAASGRKAAYASLVTKAATLPVPKAPPLKKSSDYKLIGKRLPRLDTPSKVAGTAVFGIDFRLPNMKYALLARSPVIGGKVANFDDTESRKIAGVSHVGKVGDSAVAVVADSVWNAMEGRRVLKVTWDEGANKDFSSSSMLPELKAAALKKGVPLQSAGDASKAVGRHFESEYDTPFLAHAPMEPGNCTAHFQGNRCELWAPTQVPQDVRDSVAAALALKPEQVVVNVTLMGGGFGRRLEHDYGVEAALVSKLIGGPVKVLWTREDDMHFSTYRPVSYHKLSATLDAQGWPTSFAHRLVSPSISRLKGSPIEGGIDPDLKDEASFLYPIPNLDVTYHDLDTPVPLGWMRSVYASQSGFATECFIDELAHAAGKDPLAYRLHLLSENKEIAFFDTKWRTDRLRNVLKLAAEKANWTKPLPAGRYRGIAAYGCFGSYVAEVVEISLQNGAPVVHRVVVAVDCGQVINPNTLEQQIQGGVIFALSAALRGKITMENGQVVQSNFDTYQPVRMNEAPVVEVYPVSSTEAPTGAGEPPVPPLGAALCNALFVATRKRVRSLPLAR
jgi:isoquinoline 1-oxidoreductase beta subunit